MLGSILTNLLFVFGMSCLIGGIRWQVQEIRVISGNVSVGMLYLAAAGSLLPAALFLSGQLPSKALDDDIPTREELVFCRINALVMVLLYFCYLLFQLGTHKDEFDDTNEQSAAKHNHPAKRNLWCQHHIFRERRGVSEFHLISVEEPGVPPPRRLDKVHLSNSNVGINVGINGINIPDRSVSSDDSISDAELENDQRRNESMLPMPKASTKSPNRRRARRIRRGEGGRHGSFSSSSSADEGGLNFPTHGMWAVVLRLLLLGWKSLDSCLHRAQF
jgi:Sodium/calcium exchanger protein